MNQFPVFLATLSRAVHAGIHGHGSERTGY